MLKSRANKSVKQRPSLHNKRKIHSIQRRKATNKVYPSADAAVKASKLKNGDTLIAGGFGLSGIPMSTIQAIERSGVRDLTVVSNNCGVQDWGLGILLKDRRIKRMVASYVGENAEFERQYLEGELELQFVPQGTLAEKMRSGGAGIAAFWTPTGVGTLLQQGGFPIKYKQGKERIPEILSPQKEVRNFNGRDYVLEESITGDVAIVKAWKADEFGNLQFRATARNFNPDAAMAGRFTIAEVEEIVPTGTLDPSQIHLSGGFVQAVIKTTAPKKIERLITIPKTGPDPNAVTDPNDIRLRVARRAALEVQPDTLVNLGIGMPTLIPSLLPRDMNVMFQSENGVLGMGPHPIEGEEDPDMINAGKQTVTFVPGASVFSSSDSFAMIRGGHVHLTVLGALEVAQNGDLANWLIPGKKANGPGGAMSLVSSKARVVVTMEHTNKRGDAKILKTCALPLTGKSCVDRIITNLAVFDVDKINNELILIEKHNDVTIEQLQSNTGCDFKISPNLTEYQQIPM